jgi:hypothetical protein
MKTRTVFLLFVVFIFYSTSSHSSVYAQSDSCEYTASEFWQTTLSTYLHLDKKQFKLCEGVHTLGVNTYWIWSVFNAITVIDNSYWYNPSQHNYFTHGYGLILYQSKTKPSQDSCNLNNAILKFESAQQSYAWDKTIENLHIELIASDSLNIIADTTIILEQPCGLSTKRITIEAHFDHILVFISNPLAKLDTLNHYLKSYKPWFTPCFIASAYENVNNTILSPKNWEQAFGPTGYLNGVCKATIIANKGYIKISETSNVIKAEYTTKIISPVMLGVLACYMKDYLSYFYN